MIDLYGEPDDRARADRGRRHGRGADAGPGQEQRPEPGRFRPAAAAEVRQVGEVRGQRRRGAGRAAAPAGYPGGGRGGRHLQAFARRSAAFKPGWQWCDCCAHIVRAGDTRPRRVPAAYLWATQVGNRFAPCVSCCACWRQNAVDDPSLEPARVCSLPGGPAGLAPHGRAGTARRPGPQQPEEPPHHPAAEPVSRADVLPPQQVGAQVVGGYPRAVSGPDQVGSCRHLRGCAVAEVHGRVLSVLFMSDPFTAGPVLMGRRPFGLPWLLLQVAAGKSCFPGVAESAHRDSPPHRHRTEF